MGFSVKSSGTFTTRGPKRLPALIHPLVALLFKLGVRLKPGVVLEPTGWASEKSTRCSGHPLRPDTRARTLSVMVCPDCRSPETRVLDSRPVAIGTRRRRECDACGARFTTYERAQSARHVGEREPERTGAAA